ncbi:MAG: aminotransferase class V-fold PLP-dependent enzyme [Candidatus Delongbacteria bacterium]|nr:aminotransferase class V-fold PLP-dependent enzyme [Candidatus Delongbacteria bacterium]
MIYFDNSATSYPKPSQVTDAVIYFMTKIGANPGRAGHSQSVKAGEIVFEARKKVAVFFGLKSPMNVIFTSNATEALNTAVKGLLIKGDHVITSAMEHNSVMRPLKRLEEDGIITFSVLEGDDRGVLSVEEVIKAIKPATKVLVINHMSNVTGAVQPVREIGELCRSKGVLTILDCAQSAGIIPLDMCADYIDIVCFTGHKGLYGPTGTGGMVIRDGFDFNRIRPLKEGGTGSLSDKTVQPAFMPDKFESGTLNAAGIAGLSKGIDFLNSLPEGLKSVQLHKQTLQKYFIEKAKKHVKGFVTQSETEGYGVVSFTIEGLSVSEVTMKLSDLYGIMSRQGLHCAPLAHRRIGTFPEGTVRFGFSVFNTRDEIDSAVKALKEIAGGN